MVGMTTREAKSEGNIMVKRCIEGSGGVEDSSAEENAFVRGPCVQMSNSKTEEVDDNIPGVPSPHDETP